MKKFNLLMAAMMLIAASFVACNNDEVDNGGNNKPDVPNVPPVEDVTFEFSEITADANSVTFTATPSDNDADYLVLIHNAAVVNQCDSDAAIVEMLYENVKSIAEQNGTTFADYLTDTVKRGVLANHAVSGLTASTSYYILAFAVDATNNFAATSSVSMKRFTTLEQPVVPAPCTFTITANVNGTNASIKVTPSDETKDWHLVNVTVADMERYTKGEEYGWTKDEFFQNYLNTEIETLKAEGLTDEQISTKLFNKGVRTLSDTGLEAKTKYIVLVGTVDIAEGEAVLSSELGELRYWTKEALENDLTFDIDVLNIDHYSADITITPSNLEAEYYYYIGYIDSPKRGMEPADIANAAITEYIYYWNENNQLTRREPAKGVVDFTGENKYELNLAETEYFIVAFSFDANPTYGTIIDAEAGTYDSNPGTITSTPVYVTFKTPEHGDPMNASFEFNATDVGPYDFYLEVKAADPTIYYLPGVEATANFDGQAKMSAYASFLAQQIQMCMEGQSPCLTIQEALEMKCSSFFRNGSGRYYIANLTPETDYTCYLLAIDVKTGLFAKCYSSEVSTKTISVGTVTPSIEVLGVYNGNLEAGEIFGDADATSNKPIIAVKYNFEGASAVYTHFTAVDYEVENIDNPTSKSHQYIISNFRGYWNELKSFVTPYDFFFGKWDVDNAILAYAQDANGNEGLVARHVFTPSTVSGGLDELRGYVAEYNNAITPVAAAKSMVIAEEGKPVVECIWSEEVGAPRDAEVTYHKVEPLKMASDLVRVKVVKSFHI